MNDFWTEVRDVFGPDVEQRCRNEGISLKRIQYGAFMVQNDEDLERFQTILTNSKQKLNSYVHDLTKRERPKETKETCNLKSETLSEVRTSKYKRKRVHVACEAKTISSQLEEFFCKINMSVYLQDTSIKLPCPLISSYSEKCILTTVQSGSEICEDIMKTNIFPTNRYTAEKVPKTLFSTLENFQHKHKKFHYHSVLGHLVEDKLTEENCNYQMTKQQLKQFLNLVVCKVVPWTLFGNCRNVKKIKKAMYYLILTPRYKSLDLKPVLKKLDLSKIQWLKSITDEIQQWIIMAKLLKWFFLEYVIKILRTVFHITHSPSAFYERFFVARTKWIKVQQQFKRQIRKREILKPVIEYDNWEPPTGTYKLLPKQDGVRPLLIARYCKQDQTDSKTVLKFLEQLYVTNYGIKAQATFHEKWRSLKKERINCNDKNVCLVSCDVVDAYGSVNQEKLFEIIENLCDELPDTLKFQWYKIAQSNAYKHQTIFMKQYFDDENLKFSMPPRTVCRVMKNHFTELSKNWLLDRIWSHIFCQKVEIRNKTYLIGKGVIQGGMLSSVLSNIYYGYIFHRVMSTALNSGFLLRYMDDVLYITRKEDSAKKFFNLTVKGILRYNCRFKTSKTQSNKCFTDNSVTSKINYLGYEIQCDTLEVLPKYPEIHSSYIVSLARNYDRLLLDDFRHKICNTQVLKLSKIVLDETVNSKTTIMDIIKKAILLQVSRVAAILLEMFNDVPKFAFRIFKSIRKSNAVILRVILRNYYAGNLSEEMDANLKKWGKEIIHLLWESYLKIFSKNDVLAHNFRGFIIREIKASN